MPIIKTIVYLHFITLFCSTGGVELLAQQGKIKVENLILSRLDMLYEQVNSSDRSQFRLFRLLTELNTVKTEVKPAVYYRDRITCIIN